MVQEEPCVCVCVCLCVRTVLLLLLAGLFLEAHTVSWLRSRVSQDKHEFAIFIIYDLNDSKFSALCVCVCFLSNAS